MHVNVINSFEVAALLLLPFSRQGTTSMFHGSVDFNGVVAPTDGGLKRRTAFAIACVGVRRMHGEAM